MQNTVITLYGLLFVEGQEFLYCNQKKKGRKKERCQQKMSVICVVSIFYASTPQTTDQNWLTLSSPHHFVFLLLKIDAIFMVNKNDKYNEDVFGGELNSSWIWLKVMRILKSMDIPPVICVQIILFVKRKKKKRKQMVERIGYDYRCHFGDCVYNSHIGDHLFRCQMFQRFWNRKQEKNTYIYIH